MDWSVCMNMVILMLLAFVVGLYIVKRGKGQGNNLPPGPPGLPVIGHLHLLGDLPHRALSTLAKSYGPLLFLRLGSAHCVVASSPEMAMEFFKTHDASCASRPNLAVGRLLFYNSTDITWAQFGPHWRDMRKLCIVELFTHKRLQESSHIRSEEISCTIQSIVEDSAGNRAINLNSRLSNLATNAMTRMAMGKKYFGKDNDEGADWFRRLVQEIFLLAGAFNVGDFLPFLAWLDLQGYERRMKRLHKELDAFLESIVQERRTKNAEKGAESRSRHDLVDVLLAKGLKNENIKAIVEDVIVGGSDTVTVTMEWVLAELLKSPRIMEKVQEEIDQVVGKNRNVEEEDVSNLPYLQAVLKESFRLHPPGPLLLPHESIEPCNVAGFQIPKGTRIIVNAWHIGRDPSVWENPELFNPERFIGSKVDVKGTNFELIPFGAGRRICPGLSWGLCIAQITLARLLQKFDWKLADGFKTEELDLKEKYRGTGPLAQSLQVHPTPRF